MEALHWRLLNPKQLVFGLFASLESYFSSRLLVETVARQSIHDLEIVVLDLFDMEQLSEVLRVRLGGIHSRVVLLIGVLDFERVFV